MIRFWCLGAMLAWLPACSVAFDQPKVIAGQWFPEAALARIERGDPVAEVQRVGGVPLETEKTGDGERWRYFMSVERNEREKLFGVIPLGPRRSVRTFELVFVIRDGVVAEVIARDGRGPA